MESTPERTPARQEYFDRRKRRAKWRHINLRMAKFRRSLLDLVDEFHALAAAVEDAMDDETVIGG
jgi:molecular chaperone GrpE (heat shock protein)